MALIRFADMKDDVMQFCLAGLEGQLLRGLSLH